MSWRGMVWLCCPHCEGDGYLERFNKDHSGVITELCPHCDGTGNAKDDPSLSAPRKEATE